MRYANWHIHSFIHYSVNQLLKLKFTLYAYSLLLKDLRFDVRFAVKKILD